MGIDISVRWNGQTEAERREQASAAFSVTSGHLGYLREAYHGEPYATKHLVPEAFKAGEARIPATVLRERLPETLLLAEKRERKLYRASHREIEEVKQSYRDFVAFCEKQEAKSGEPVTIEASY